MHTARRAELRVPEDLSVIGIDGHEMAELFDLTTVGQPVDVQVELAVRMLLAARSDPAAVTLARTVPTELVVRDTMAPPGNG